MDHLLSEWQRCLSECLALLNEAVQTISSASNFDIRKELLTTQQIKDYLRSKENKDNIF